MQDETKGSPIQEFCGLRAKLYSIKVGQDQKLASAGTKAHVARKHLTHERYVDVLNGEKEFNIRQNTIRSFNHQVYTIAQKRVALCAIDDKRHTLPDNSTRALGHFENREMDTQKRIAMLLDHME